MVREDRDITRIIHFQCLMLDELDEKIAKGASIRVLDLVELKDKAKQIMDCADKLIQIQTQP